MVTSSGMPPHLNKAEGAQGERDKTEQFRAFVPCTWSERDSALTSPTRAAGAARGRAAGERAGVPARAGGARARRRRGAPLAGAREYPREAVYTPVHIEFPWGGGSVTRPQ